MKVERSALLPYSSAQIYSVISDVSSYPEFLNWCTEARVERDSESRQIAELKIAYGRLKLVFSTANTMRLNELIEMRLVDGPFKHLTGQWTINSLGESACKVSLQMEFAFANPITHRLLGQVFHKVVSAQVDAFEKRANELYGS